MKLLLYLLQVSACSGLFYLFYYLVLRRLTFFTLNRWYLLVSLLVSFAVPVVTIPVDVPGQATVAPVVLPTADIAEAFEPEQAVPASQSATVPATIDTAPAKKTIAYGSLLELAYMAVAGILLLRLLFSLFLIIYRLKKETAEKRGSIKLIRNSRYFRTGSFFSYVFISDKDLNPQESEQVLAHEAVHVTKLHSIDKLLAGFAKVVLWFNPFAYAYALAIDANHEFEVDSTLTAGREKKPYAELLLRLAVGETNLYHHFSRLPLQKRIKMLYHKPSGNLKKLAYLFALPLMAAALFAFAQRKAESIYHANVSHHETLVNSAVVDSKIESAPQQQEQTISEAVAQPTTNDEKVTVSKVIAVPEREPQKALMQNSVALTDYNHIKKIQRGQTTLQEVQKLFGKPSRTEVSGDYNNWYFETEHIRLAVRFDKENKVVGFNYRTQKPDASPALTAETARTIKINATNEAEIIKMFGLPSDVSISTNQPNNVMRFFYSNRQSNTSLSVRFYDKGSDYVVTHYAFSAQTHEPVVIYPDKVTPLEKGKTTMTETEKIFGEPTAKKIYGHDEMWVYTSQRSFLELRFKYKKDIDEVVLDNYRYESVDKE